MFTYLNKIKKLVLLLIIPFTLVSCQKGNETTIINKNFITDTNKEDLDYPKKVLDSRDDFKYLIDYMAFYKIDKRIDILFSDNYLKDFYSPYQEMLEAYQSSDIGDNYGIQILYDNFEKTKTATIYLTGLNTKNDIISEIDTTDIYKLYKEPIKNKINDVIYRPRNKKIKVTTSEQLFYAVQNRYDLELANGSIAYEIYNTAKDILSNIISQDDTTLQMIETVYTYLVEEIHYDPVGYTSDYNNQRNQAYFLEGVFLNKQAVCDAKAKAYSLLLNLLNIECYRLTGSSENGDHAWNVIKYQDKYYLSDTTFGAPSKIMLDKDYSAIVPSLNMLLTSKKTPYESFDFKTTKYVDIDNTLVNEIDVYKELGLIIKDIDELKNLTDKIMGKNIRFEFEYIGADSNFINYLKEEYNDSNIYLIKAKGNNIFEILFKEKL